MAPRRAVHHALLGVMVTDDGAWVLGRGVADRDELPLSVLSRVRD